MKISKIYNNTTNNKITVTTTKLILIKFTIKRKINMMNNSKLIKISITKTIFSSTNS